MVKVYLLLRNNKQSGPYSLEELAQQQLRPLDLIWIEGRSAAWKYASEIPALHPYLPAGTDLSGAQSFQGSQKAPSTGSTNTQTHTPSSIDEAHKAYLPAGADLNGPSLKKPKPSVYVSLPTNAKAGATTPAADSVSKAVEPKVVAPKPAQEPLRAAPEPKSEDTPKEKLVTKYAATLDEKEEAYTEWIYKTKTKRNSLAPEWIGGIAVIVLLLMGSAAYFIRNSNSDEQAAAPLTATDTRSTEELASTVSQPEPSPETTSQAAAETADPGIPAPAPANTADYNVPAINNARVIDNSRPGKTAAVSGNTKPVEKTAAKITTANTTPVTTKATTNASGKAKLPVTPAASGENQVTARAPEPVVEEAAPVVTKTSKTAVPDAGTTEKKKTFSDKVDGFFNRLVKAKKVEPGAPAGTPPPTPSEAGTDGERKATRRTDPAPAASTTSAPAKKDLTSGVELNTIAPSNSWMQGVHGMKMKISNRNDVKISNAAVEVRYLNEQNAVIEKKTVRLSSIAPGKSVTVDIPDHRIADHAEASLISANN